MPRIEELATVDSKGDESEGERVGAKKDGLKGEEEKPIGWMWGGLKSEKHLDLVFKLEAF